MAPQLACIIMTLSRLRFVSNRRDVMFSCIFLATTASCVSANHWYMVLLMTPLLRPLVLACLRRCQQPDLEVRVISLLKSLLDVKVAKSSQLQTIKFTQQINSLDVVCGMLHGIQQYEYTTRLIRSHRGDGGLQTAKMLVPDKSLTEWKLTHQGEEYSLSEYYSRKGYDHPQAAFRRRSDVAGPGECPPCPESWT